MIRSAACVYVIGEPDGPNKIGVSSAPQMRLKQLRCDEKRPLQLLHSVDRPAADSELIEKTAHALLAAKRIRGEWFDVTCDEAIAAVTEAVAIVENGPPVTNREVAVAKSALLNIRFAAADYAALCAVAAADQRRPSEMARLVLEAWMDGEELPAAKLTSEGRRLAVERELSRREGERDE